MKEEKLIDAMALLPEEMLEETDRLRQKKRTPWKGIAAVAACLCLVAGLWLLYPGNKTAENAFNGLADKGSDGATEKMEAASGSHPQAGSVLGHKFCGKEYVDVTVVKVYDGKIGVLEGWRGSYIIDGIGDLISTAYLEKPPELSPGQHLRIYFGDTLEAYMDPDLGDPVLIPQKIEVFE